MHGAVGRTRTAALAAITALARQDFGHRGFLWPTNQDRPGAELDSRVRKLGWANIWTQPIINRVDMLATGVRTQLARQGLRPLAGADPGRLEPGGRCAARRFPARSTWSPTRRVGKGYVEIEVDRERAARYGVNVGDIQDVIEVALGGKPITTTVEGRERYPVRVALRARLPRGRGVDQAHPRVGRRRGGNGVRAAGGAMGAIAPRRHGQRRPRKPVQYTLGDVADVRVVEGPVMIKSENGLLRSYVQLNVRDRDIVGFVEEAQRVSGAAR